MIIDFHTHIFPEKIAGKTISKLSGIINLEPSMNGTVEGLRASMEKSGIDLSVVLPVVTAPGQFDSILKFASYINETYSHCEGPKLLSFAGIHPDCSDCTAKLHQIAREGFRGIKIHPNYQGKYFDDISYLRIIYTASELGLLVLTHAGFDPVTPDEIFCSPDMVLHVLEETGTDKLVLAHMGANKLYKEVIDKLCGKNVYLDTSYSLMNMDPELAASMVKLHGADKILFGTDAPWTSQKESVERLNSLSALSPKEKQQIFHENAAALLRL